MVIETVRLPDDTAVRLEELAKATRRSRSSLIVEALRCYLEERDDLEAALARVREPQAEYLDHDEVKRALDID